VSVVAPPASGPETRSERSERLAELFQEHADFVWRILRRLGLSPADAEDATQEVFLVVNHRLDDYEDRGATRAWLFAIGHQVARAHQRRASRTSPVEDLGDSLASNDDPSRTAEQNEAAAAINQFLATLSEPQAMVFYLLEIEAMTAPEAAVALGVGVNTVYGRLRLAHRRFEAFLARRAVREERTWR
jgi:RNA polymerase sigma-70 factor (ECF subfamily)